MCLDNFLSVQAPGAAQDLFKHEDKLFIFDFDGTLTQKELLPEIGKLLGIFEELEQLTNDTISGKISFEASFRARVDMLSNANPIAINDMVRSVPKFDRVIEWMQNNRHRVVIATGNLDIWLWDWVHESQIPTFASSGAIVSGRTSLSYVLDKAKIRDVFPDKTLIVIGDGANDAALMRRASIGIAAEMVHEVPDVVLQVCGAVIKSEESMCSVLNLL